MCAVSVNERMTIAIGSAERPMVLIAMQFDTAPHIYQAELTFTVLDFERLLPARHT